MKTKLSRSISVVLLLCLLVSLCVLCVGCGKPEWRKAYSQLNKGGYYFGNSTRSTDVRDFVAFRQTYQGHKAYTLDVSHICYEEGIVMDDGTRYPMTEPGVPEIVDAVYNSDSIYGSRYMIRDDTIVFYDVGKEYSIVDVVHISTCSRYENDGRVTHTYCLELVLEEEAYHVGLQTIYLEMSIFAIDGKNFEFQLHNCNLYLRFIEHVLLTQPYLSTKMVEIFFQAGMHSEMPYKVLLDQSHKVPEVEVLSAFDYFVMPNNQQNFYLKVNYHGIYELPKDFDVYFNDILYTEDTIKLEPGKYRFKLANTTNQIKQGQLIIGVVNNSVVAEPNKEYVVQLTIPKGLNVLTTADEDVVICSIFDFSGLINPVLTDSFEVYDDFESGDYYVVLKNNSTTAKEVTVSIKPVEEFTKDSSSLIVPAGQTKLLNKLVTDKQGKYTIITSERIIVILTNGDEHWAADRNYENGTYSYELTLDAGQMLYIYLENKDITTDYIVPIQII